MRLKKDEQSLSNLWNNIKQANMYLTRERKWGPKLEETGMENIAQIWKKENELQIQEA